MSNRLLAAVAILILPLLSSGAAIAGDEEGCLFCHRLGLAVRSGKEVRELRVEEKPEAAHGPLYCSDCHPDAKVAPHSGRPSPASCVGDCHGDTASARESHRNASAGGGTEVHRKASFPRAPCLLCHRSADKTGSTEGTESRCRACHPGEARDNRRGVHSRVTSVRGANRCATCHPPHPGTGGGETASCAGPGCHDRVTKKTILLARHEGGPESAFSFRRATRGGLFLAIVILGWIGGRRLSAGKDAAKRP